MAYVPKDWVTGEVITEQALDHIEQGVAGMIMYVHITMTDNVATMDKTLREIANALASGVIVAVLTNGGSELEYSFDFVYGTMIDTVSNDYVVTLMSDPSGQNISFRATSADDYPSYDFG